MEVVCKEMDIRTIALNIAYINDRIKRNHTELEALHEQKDELEDKLSKIKENFSNF